MQKIKEESGVWKKLEIGRRERKPQAYFSRGRAKYVRFNPSLMNKYKLQDKKTVDIFIMGGKQNIFIAFKFRDDNEGTLTLSKNKKTGTGYLSASSLFNEVGIDNKKIKQNSFTLEESDINGKALVLELDRKLLD